MVNAVSQLIALYTNVNYKEIRFNTSCTWGVRREKKRKNSFLGKEDEGMRVIGFKLGKVIRVKHTLVSLPF